MSQVHEGLENKSFSQPADIVAQTVCAQSGRLPTALCGETLKTEYFAADTVPTETCDVHYQGSVCAYSGLPRSRCLPLCNGGYSGNASGKRTYPDRSGDLRGFPEGLRAAPSSWQPRCRSDHRAGNGSSFSCAATLHSTKLCS